MDRLTDRTVKTAKPGTYQDGTVKGLLLLVRPSGARSWVLRYQIAGRRRDMGLGPYPEVTLADAREAALEQRRVIRRGVDPLADRIRSKPRIFRDVAADLIADKSPGWRNAKHAAQWAATLETYAYPVIGDLDVKAVGTDDVLQALRPIWSTKPETASRVRQRIEAVLDRAGALKLRTGDNVARWKGHLDHLLAKPSKVRAVEHHAALPWQAVPSFMVELAKREGVAARALAFVILTAARSGEVRGMTWGEIDLEARLWTVPAARIKAGKEHRVPLQPAAIALLGEPGDPEALVFPSPGDAAKPLSDMTLSAVLKRMKVAAVPHGFRSSFRDWAGEATAHPREVIEHALAHGLKDKSEAAYARGTLFAKRRKLMDDWAGFLASPAATVLGMQRAAASM